MRAMTIKLLVAFAIVSVLVPANFGTITVNQFEGMTTSPSRMSNSRTRSA